MIIGKVIVYYMYELVKKGMSYFSGKPNYKQPVKKILDLISSNRQVINDISKIIGPKGDIDNGAADRIVKLGFVQTQINKIIGSKDSNLDKTELENQIKTIIIKSWNDLGDNAVEKVKKDLK